MLIKHIEHRLFSIIMPRSNISIWVRFQKANWVQAYYSQCAQDKAERAKHARADDARKAERRNADDAFWRKKKAEWAERVSVLERHKGVSVRLWSLLTLLKIYTFPKSKREIAEDGNGATLEERDQMGGKERGPQKGQKGRSFSIG